MLHQGTGSSFGLDGVGRASRNDFLLKGDIRRIEKEIEAETIRLDPDDGKSLFRWADRLRSVDALLGFKSISCPVPSGSGLAPDAFSLMIQTSWQRAQFRAYGRQLLCIDGTHNTTMYQNTILTTLLVWDHWGRGEL